MGFRQDWPQHVAYGALVADIGKLDAVRGVDQLSRPDAKTIIATERRAKRGEILGQAVEGERHRRLDTDPSPKSVSRL